MRYWKACDPTLRGDNYWVKIVKFMYFFEKMSSQPSGIHVYSNNDQWRIYQNCKFPDTQGRGSYARVWPNKSYSKNVLTIFYDWNIADRLLNTFQSTNLKYSAKIRQTEYIVMMVKEGSIEIVNFMNPGVGVVVVRCGHIGE